MTKELPVTIRGRVVGKAVIGEKTDEGTELAITFNDEFVHGLRPSLNPLSIHIPKESHSIKDCKGECLNGH